MLSVTVVLPLLVLLLFEKVLIFAISSALGLGLILTRLSSLVLRCVIQWPHFLLCGLGPLLLRPRRVVASTASVASAAPLGSCLGSLLFFIIILTLNISSALNFFLVRLARLAIALLPPILVFRADGAAVLATETPTTATTSSSLYVVRRGLIFAFFDRGPGRDKALMTCRVKFARLYVEVLGEGIRLGVYSDFSPLLRGLVLATLASRSLVSVGDSWILIGRFSLGLMLFSWEVLLGNPLLFLATLALGKPLLFLPIFSLLLRVSGAFLVPFAVSVSLRLGV